MTTLLTLKHWQLFLFLMGLPTILQIVVMVSMISQQAPVTSAAPLIILLPIGFFFAWFYALGTNLHSRLPDTVKMSLTKFKIFLFIPVLYMLVLSMFLYSIFKGSTQHGQPNPAIFALIMPLHLFSMFCIFYCLYFNAKALKTVELQRPVTFSDFAGEFFLIWFFPIGVWIIQPRINKIFDTTIDNDNNQILDSSIQ